MKKTTGPFISRRPFEAITCLAALVVATSLAQASDSSSAAAPALLDDFSDPARNNYGGARLVITDKDLGSQSHAKERCENGVLAITGELVPGRGVPAFISVPLLLSADGQPRDLSAFTGVRLRVKLDRGMLSVQASSTKIDNFDYHTSPPLAVERGTFQEVRVPFQDMKRAWSEQTTLDLTTITSINLVAFGMARDEFAYEVDEIGFY